MMTIVKGFDPFKVIKKALSRGGEFCDIYMEDTSSTSISCEEDRIEKVVSGRDAGCGIRVIKDYKTYYVYTNDVTEEGLLSAASVAANAAGRGSFEKDISLARKDVAPGFSIKKKAIDIPLQTKIELVKRGNIAGRGVSNVVKQVKVAYGDSQKRVAIVNSLGEWVEEELNYLIYFCFVVAAKDSVIQTGYEPAGGVLGLEMFDETPPELIAEKAGKLAVMMLTARKAPAGKMPVVLSSSAGGTMIHEAVGHGLEADLAGEKLSVYSGKLGTVVASPLITVIDDGTIPNKRGSSFFDGEGSPTQRTVLVQEGVLKGYMFDRLTAMKEGKKSTGNGRRESYRHRPIPRMTNTMIAPGDGSPGDVVKGVKKGLFVKKMGGGQVNTVNGDFVFEVSEGYMIENGKVCEPVRGATLTGNGPEVLKTIDMVSSDLGFGIGTCGKDGQGVPVADAQPTLRIPEIVVGGETQG